MSVRQTEQIDGTSAAALAQRFEQVRRHSHLLCQPLETEDYVIQSMPDVSPTRWHLAHTTWFFETFVLRHGLPGYRSPHPAFQLLFNSYYNTIGEQFPRPRRGLLSRPTVAEVFDYREHVDAAMHELLTEADVDENDDLLRVVEIGLHHEQQHQELMLTDIKHVLSCNPLHPVYLSNGTDLESVEWRVETNVANESGKIDLGWIAYDEQLASIGHAGSGFAFDNELPRHRTLVEDYQLADRLVTNREYLAFIDDGGYQTAPLWLSDGWTTIQNEGWQAPLYWVPRGDEWMQFTLHGLVPLDLDEPVCHVSYYEADAFARWAGARLPTEAEWEVAAAECPVAGNFADDERFHPRAASGGEGRGRNSRPRHASPRQMFGDVWEWTASAYSAYPGYRPAAGALGEYNGKFMCNQFVLRGGSCATPRSHIRLTYRNFFPPQARWQFTGIRLAKS